ncbi:hypothetical protein [Methylobacterium radiodurans]|uniref:hypothetical protein n=1 Tax=Methylobacterium radiodurans TaxID=2202828 RepID=UPI0013A58B79|nr:hypothetical protein [Methylobacterium radiodurans]
MSRLPAMTTSKVANRMHLDRLEAMSVNPPREILNRAFDDGPTGWPSSGPSAEAGDIRIDP